MRRRSFLAITAVATLVIGSYLAMAGGTVLRCEGKGSPWGATAEVHISLPSNNDGRLWFFREPEPPVLVNGSAGVGRIMVRLISSDTSIRTATFEHPFVITRIPTSPNTTLEGLYFTSDFDPKPWIVQANKARAFWMAGDGQQYVGACD
jgi:hypothetical protein